MGLFSRLTGLHPIIKYLIAYLVGASTALSFAPYGYWPIYVIALAVGLWQSQTLTPKQAFKYWLSFGFGCFSVGISWVHVSMADYGGMPLIASIALMALLALYLALYPAIAGYLSQKYALNVVWRNLLLFPAWWVVLEWARGWVLTGFPWLWAGYSQTHGPLAPLASVIGALGLTYLIALLAGTLALTLHKQFKPLIAITAMLALSTYAVVQTDPLSRNGDSVNVALVQGNIAQSMKWEPDALWPTMVKYMDLSRQSLAETDIFIWPEAAIPAPEYLVKDFLDNANKVANLNDSAIITGIIGYRNDDFYNSLIVLGNYDEKQQVDASYVGDGSNEFRKHHLLPIGEFVPLEDLLRPLAPFFNLPMSSFARGDYLQPNLSALGYQLTPAICFEIAFSEQVRANITEQTDLLLTVSNDAWFGSSNGPLQHMEMAQMRAIEFGRPLLRGTNNGVTAVANEYGEITHQLPQFETGVLTANVPLVSGTTWYTRLGEWPVLLFCTLALMFATIKVYRRKLTS
ncbi:apolipoprotein N-acyltransferase [Shewanella sp. Scap07]|uniref:apolipoprotein N-acyltransferase n=1 Tax=Shewanella sp. Scap07 TaxID=2589987 RepID=UPI0015BF0515|nr:apolipoprotein N-acyltransferase [Shewanella sp. Scap07]QLE86458.1 apolipoprotein N-acyltransferase [Shewanella sp. Scap07]